MKTAIIAALALTAAAAPLSAGTLNADRDGLTLSQRAQIFAVENSDENTATKERQIEAILDESNASGEGTPTAQTMFEEESGENTPARERVVESN